MRGFHKLAVAVVAVVPLVAASAASPVNDNANYRAVCPDAGLAAAHCHALVVTDGNGNPNASTAPSGYGPTQFRTAYGLSGTAGGTPTIAIVDAYDDPNAEADLATYSSQYGLPSCTSATGCFTKVGQGGGAPPRPDHGWALEISLDVQIAHAICGNCKILLVEASSNRISDLAAAEVYATAHAGVVVVSNSYGAKEFSGETAYDAPYTGSSVAITVSSGDSGYGVEWPAANPFVIAVGGTTLNLTGGNTRSSETVWSGTGSGCSSVEAKQPWQHDSGCSKRTVVDVAADADPNTGAAVYDSYGYYGEKGWFQVGGTSLSSPLIAGVIALAGNGASMSDASYIYSHATSSTLYDVTSGTNGGPRCTTYLCNAGSGYDGPTGLGTPIGTGAF
jgi:subtilase family serine protease